ncbi:MAG: HD-GYP domain-containing protein [Gemmatimonadaceae bacterium]
MNKVVLYVIVCCALAVATVVAVVEVDPSWSMAYAQAAICFGSLALLGNYLAYELEQGAVGSIAFLPFLALAVVAPHWISLLAVGVTVAVDGARAKRAVVKVCFNIAQAVISLGVGIGAYLLIGGSALHQGSRIAPLACGSLVAVFFAVNSTAVSGVLALARNRPFAEIWRQNTLQTVIYDFLAAFFVYLLAWCFVSYGPLGAFVLAIPMLAVREIYKTSSQLQRVNQELLQLMVAAIEARDPYTSGHSRRVQRYAVVIARCLGCRAKEVERVGVSALLHDVGKIHEVFAPILSKPDRLTPEEIRIMQTHPIKSAELVGTVSHLMDVLPAVKHHHENWDGSGYPDGLSGADIPTGARIIMIADTVDAMTSDRPYRKALSGEQVRGELRRMAGAQFDPIMVETLLANPEFSKLLDAHHALTPPRGFPFPSTIVARRRSRLYVP